MSYLEELDKRFQRRFDSYLQKASAQVLVPPPLEHHHHVPTHGNQPSPVPTSRLDGHAGTRLGAIIRQVGAHARHARHIVEQMQSQNPHLTDADKDEQLNLLLEIFQQNVSEMLDETFNSLMGHPVALPIETHGPTHERKAHAGDDDLAKATAWAERLERVTKQIEAFAEGDELDLLEKAAKAMDFDCWVQIIERCFGRMRKALAAA